MCFLPFPDLLITSNVVLQGFGRFQEIYTHAKCMHSQYTRVFLTHFIVFMLFVES